MPSIAIVGCRQASTYGKKVAQYFSYYLSKKGMTIISGLAKGIDSQAHIGAMKAKGITIGVIGSGLDMVYPKGNQYLYDSIIKENGAIISEYPLGMNPLKMNFPARNRLISALADKLVVVEAENEKSGTMITVDFSLELGKEIYVVPGNINNKMSVGTNRLIKDGAKIITEFNDIIDEDY